MKHTFEESFASSDPDAYKPMMDQIGERMNNDLVEKLEKAIKYYLPREGKQILEECEANNDLSPMAGRLTSITHQSFKKENVYCWDGAPFLKVWDPDFHIDQRGSTVIIRGEQKFKGVTWDPDNTENELEENNNE